MSILSLILAASIVIASVLCLLDSKLRALGAAMLLSLVFYIQPVRGLFEFGQHPAYLFTVDVGAAIIIMAFDRTIAGKVVLLSIVALITFAHIPATLPNLYGYGSIFISDTIANYAGWFQVLAMIGGAIAGRRRINAGSYDWRRFGNINRKPIAATYKGDKARNVSSKANHSKNM